MTDLQQDIRRLVGRANRRLRLQRLAEVGCTALLPALVLAAMAILLTKHGLLLDAELPAALLGLGALVIAVALAAALWPIPTLPTLMRLDRGSDFSDRLSSAWDFLGVRESERTPEMALHIRRTGERVGEVSVAASHRFRRPGDALAVLPLLAVALFVGLLAEPSPEALPSTALVEPPPPMFILDLAALRPEIRQIEALAELAERSDDPAIQAVAEELTSILERAERGLLDEETLLDELATIEERLGALDAEPPPDLSSEWEEVAETLRETLAQQPPPEPMTEEVEALLEAIERGDEGAMAEAVEQLEELLQNSDFSAEDLEALADALEQFADAFDPSDFDLRQELDALRDRVSELEERVGEGGRGGSRRDRRRLDAARERLGELEEQLADSLDNLDGGGQTRQAIEEALREAAETLRDASEPTEPGEDSGEPTEVAEGSELPEGREPGEAGAEEPAEREGSAGEERPSEQATETAERRPDEERREGESGGPRDGGERSESEGSEAAASEQPPSGEPGDPRETPGEPGGQAAAEPGGESTQSGEGQSPATGSPGEAGAGAPQNSQESAQTPQQEAAEQLSEASERLRDLDQQEASAEAQERAQEAVDGIRENLQRSSDRSAEQPRDERAENNWDDFMDRAEGQAPEERREPGEPSADGAPPPTSDPSQSGAEPSGDPGGEQAEGQSDGTPGGPGESDYGEEPGGEALADGATELDSERERVEAEVEVGSEEDEASRSTGEVIESAASEGFASRGYREVYQEYAEAVEEALRTEAVPLGYARFVERYFRLIEPR